MIPPQQRLASRYFSGLQVYERLIEQLELLVGQGPAQIDFQGAARLDDLRHLVAEETEGASAVRLGAIEGHVGILQERVGAVPVRRRHRDTDAGADLDQ